MCDFNDYEENFMMEQIRRMREGLEVPYVDEDIYPIDVIECFDRMVEFKEYFTERYGVEV